MKRIIEGLRILGCVVMFPILLVLDILGAIVGMAVRAFKEGYEWSQKEE